MAIDNMHLNRLFIDDFKSFKHGSPQIKCLKQVFANKFNILPEFLTLEEMSLIENDNKTKFYNFYTTLIPMNKMDSIRSNKNLGWHPIIGFCTVTKISDNNDVFDIVVVKN